MEFCAGELNSRNKAILREDPYFPRNTIDGYLNERACFVYARYCYLKKWGAHIGFNSTLRVRNKFKTHKQERQSSRTPLNEA
jgi:hypothetical protein